MLQRDISIRNLMMNEDDSNPSWQSFRIDINLAIKEQRDNKSGARSITGTKAFMHDLESFFWVPFWLCIHYDGPGSEGRITYIFRMLEL